MFQILTWMLSIIFISIIIWFLISTLIYRFAFGEAREIDGEMHYKFIDIGHSNRLFFERLMGNRVIKLVDKEKLYISEDDYFEVWPFSPGEIFKSDFTIEVKVQVYPLLIGGWSVGKVIDFRKVKQLPKISK